MKRHLFLLGDARDGKGGIQTFNAALMTAASELLGSYREAVVLQSFTSLPRLLAKGRFAAEVVRCLVRSRFDRVVCGHVNFAGLTRFVSRAFGVPYSVILHGFEVWDPMPERNRAALRDAEFLWSVSRYTRDRCRSWSGLPESKFKILPDVADEHRFTPGTKSKALIERFGLVGKKVLLAVARLDSRERRKGIDTVIRALPEIAKVHSDIVYLICGKGDDTERLRAISREIGVEARVAFTGYVPNAELPDYYRLADVFAMPSSQEGFGIVFLEALMTGIPVIAGRDGAAEPLMDGRLGWQVNGDVVSEVAAACLRALERNDPRCRGDWLREEAVKEFGRHRFLERLGKLLAE